MLNHCQMLSVRRGERIVTILSNSLSQPYSYLSCALPLCAFVFELAMKEQPCPSPMLNHGPLSNASTSRRFSNCSSFVSHGYSKPHALSSVFCTCARLLLNFPLHQYMFVSLATSSLAIYSIATVKCL